MVVPLPELEALQAGNRATIPRHHGTGPEAYLFSTSQGPPRRPLRVKLGTSETRGRPAAGCATRGGAGDRVICGTKRIGATTFSSMEGRPPGLCRPPRYKEDLTDFGKGARHTAQGAREEADPRPLIPDPCDAHDATMRLCRLVRLRRSRSPCLAPSGRSRWFVHNAG